jgi:ABC-type polysaccharide/polyol phosphate export permease
VKASDVLETPSAEGGSQAGGQAVPDEPRAETWFRRRIGLVSAARELWAYRELVMTLAERDLRVRYKQAALGLGWALLTPLLLMGAFGFIFTKFGNVHTGGVPYPIFAAVGLVPWTLFSTAFSRGGTSLVQNIPLLNKLYCPREVFPLSSLALALADALASLLVLALLFPILNYAPHWELVYSPLLFAILLLFTAGVTMAVSAIVVYVRDLQVLLPMVVQFGLFVTPVGYGSKAIVSTEAGAIIYAAVNPIAAVIDGLRRTILHGQAPLLWPTVAATVSSVVVLSLGFMIFKRLEAGLADIA